jgi:magnesium transporter
MEDPQANTDPAKTAHEHVVRRYAAQLEEASAPEAASVMASLPREDAGEVAEYLDPRTAGKILAAMDPAQAAGVIEQMHAPEASVVLTAMHPDDRVDVLEKVPDPLRGELLAEMPALAADEVRRLEQYPSDTVGGIMTTQVTALRADLTIEQAIAEIRRMNEQLEQMFYVYVVDVAGCLIGVLSMRDMILSSPTARLAHVMRKSVTSIPATMDQEQAARLVTKHGFLALPVVDPRGRLIGLVTMDDIVDVLEQEATEDVQRMFGAGAEERLDSPWVFSFKRRLPWLLVNLLLAGGSAAVVAAFESTIANLAVLAVYMPVVAGMGGNATAQAMAVAIRGIALGEGDAPLMRLVLREARVGLLAGFVTGLSAATVAWALHYDHGIILGVIVATTMTINLTLGCVWGVTVPFVMRRLGFDPAQSATIFTTTVTDCIGFFVLLALAALWLMR